MLTLNRLPLKPIYDAAHARMLAEELPLSRTMASVVVVPRQLDKATRQYFEARLTQLHNACGCSAGTLALLVTLGMWVAVWSMQTDPLAQSGIMFPIGLGLAVLSVGFGKWIGLWRAKQALVAELHNLARYLDEVDRNSLITGSCDSDVQTA